jgi:hypothetical protein
MPVVTVSASMPAEIAQAMHASARKADRSFSAEMRIAIRHHLGLDPVSTNYNEGPAANGTLAKERDTTAHASA